MKIPGLMAIALVLSACSSDGKDCTPGERRTCTCPDASQSLQNCNADGKWEPCDCTGDQDGGTDAGTDAGDDGGQVTDEGGDEGQPDAGDPGQADEDLPPAVTIASLRGDPPADGTPVTLEGVLVMSPVFDDYDHKDYDNPMKAFFVSAPGLATTQADSGMLVVLATGTVAPAFAPGDLVTVAGQFFSTDDPPAFGMSFVRVGDDDPMEKTGSQSLPDGAVVSVAEAASEDWEAVLVAIPTGTVTSVHNTYNTVTIDDLLEIDDHIIRSLNGGEIIPFEACVDQTVESAAGFNYFSYSARRLLPRGIDDVTLLGSCDEVIDCGDAPTADHLLLSEVTVTPSESEFVEIHNPTGSPIDLSTTYLWNATYRNVSGDCCGAPGGSAKFHWIICTAAGRTALETDWNPDFQDFLIRFPDGASIGAGEYQTVALHGKASFCQSYNLAPDYELLLPTGGDCQVGGQVVAVPAMESRPLGFASTGDAPRLSNAGEELVLFSWSGTDGDPVRDLDVLLWGDKCEAFDRSGSEACDGSGYQADTACGDQEVAGPGQHASGASFQRACTNEGSETRTGGNGLTGNDETSENLSGTWLEASPTPGAARR